MIQAEMMVAEFLPAVLAAIFVSQKHVPAIELDHVARHSVVIQQPDHAGNLNDESDGVYPVVPLVVFFESVFGVAQFAPAIEVKRLVLTVLDRDDFRLAFVKQREGSPNGDNVNRSVSSIKSQDAGLHCRCRTRT